MSTVNRIQSIRTFVFCGTPSKLIAIFSIDRASVSGSATAYSAGSVFALTFKTRVRGVGLPESQYVTGKEYCTGLGWGLGHQPGEGSASLQYGGLSRQLGLGWQETGGGGGIEGLGLGHQEPPKSPNLPKS